MLSWYVCEFMIISTSFAITLLAPPCAGARHLKVENLRVLQRQSFHAFSLRVRRDDAWALSRRHRTRLTCTSERAEPQNFVASCGVGERSRGRRLSTVR